MSNSVNLIRFATAPTWYRGEDGRNATVTNEEASSFEAFYRRILGLAERFAPPSAGLTKAEINKRKGAAPNFCRPMKNSHREGRAAEAARFIALDIDEGLTPKAKPQVVEACGLLSAFVYETASSTEENPRLRIVAEATRDILPEEVGAATHALAAFLCDQCPDWQGEIDPKCLEPDRCYVVPTSEAAKSARLFHGAPVDIDALMAQYPAPASKPTAKKATDAAEARGKPADFHPATEAELTPPPLPADFIDPAVRALEEAGLMLGAGKAVGEWRIRCPFEHEHTTQADEGDSSTVYRAANTGGRRYGQFICLHAHCAHRPQDEFFKAVGVDNARYKADIDARTGRPEEFKAAGGQFTCDGARVYFAKSLGADGYAPRVALFDRLEVVAKVRDPKGQGWGRLVRFADADGVEKERIISDADTLGDGVNVRKTLASDGLRFYSMAKNAADLLAAYLYNCPCWSRVRIVNAVGWFKPHGLTGAAVYVLPSETIAAGDASPSGEAGAEAVRFFSEAAVSADWQTRGTAEEWRTAVGVLVPQSRPLTLAVGAALGAPLAKLIDAADMTGGFHFYGAAGSGKSAALTVAAGVYGAPVKGARLTGWNDTANSLEAQAAANNDGLICLDEASTAGAGMRNKGAALADTIYRLSGGAEKGRLTRQCDARTRRQWFCLVLSTGEGALRHFVERADGTADVGLSTRVIDVPVRPAEAGGIFDNAEAGADVKALYARLYGGAAKHYGAVGRDWLTYLVHNQTAIAEKVRPWAEAFDNAAGVVSAGQQTRAFRRFQLCATAYALACEAGILGADATEGVKVIAELFKQWAAAYGEGSQEDVRLIERFREACDQPFNFPRFAGFEGALSAPDVGRRVMGFQENESTPAAVGGAPTAPSADEETPAPLRFFVLPDAFRELAGGVGVRGAGKTLKDRRILIPYIDKNGKEHAQTQKKVGGVNRRFYVLDAATLQGDGRSEDDD